MRVGLTGGIGSGKSTVASHFNELGIPVYNSDLRARELMEQDAELAEGIRGLFGKEAYLDGRLNRSYIASLVFEEKGLLARLNTLVHPAVRLDFLKWSTRQVAPYVIQEAAILIENGAYRELDRMILVTAPKAERIRRVMKRDAVPENAVVNRMKNQWEDDQKIPLADFIIENTDPAATKQRVSEVHRELLQATMG